MMLGIGIDSISTTRIEKLISKFGNKFEEKVFTKNEIIKAQNIKITENNFKPRALFYAKRFAAKEAFSKALGLGIGRGVDFKDIEIDNDNLGKPFIRILNEIENFIKDHFKVRIFIIHLSMTDEADLASAVVTISS